MLGSHVCKPEKVVHLVICTSMYVVYVTFVRELVVSSLNICFTTTVTELFDTVCKVALVVTRGRLEVTLECKVRQIAYQKSAYEN